MFNSTVLDVVIGLTFIYLILALLCTAVNEWWSKQRSLRAKFLKEGIQRLLAAGPDGSRLTQDLYQHPLIKSLARDGEHPSYVSPQVFALALVDTLKRSAAGGVDQTLLEAINKVTDAEVKRTLVALLHATDTASEAGLQRIEEWFAHAMDRVSGWYKRKMVNVTLVVALIVTVLANADTLQIVNRLWTNPTLRAAVLAEAQERAKQPSPPPLNVGYTNSSPVPTRPVVTPSGTPEANRPPIVSPKEREVLGELLSWSEEFGEFHKLAAESDQVQVYKANKRGNPRGDVTACLEAKKTVESGFCKGFSLGPSVQCEAARQLLANPTCADTVKVAENAATNASFPGWKFLTYPRVFFQWLCWLIPLRIVGWLLTVFAISLGAPFWFGTLQKLVNIRSAGDAPDEKPAVTGKRQG